MKIVAISDIHYDFVSATNYINPYQSELTEGLYNLVHTLKRERPDVLLIGGDMVGLGWHKLEECLSLLKSVCEKRLVVFGNHEHWSVKLDTFSHLNILKDVIIKEGYHLLDIEPVIIGNVGFAGNCGWLF